MRVYIFNRVISSGPKSEELDNIVSQMQYSQELRLQTILYRKCIEAGDSIWGEQIKTTKIPAFAPCALFDGMKGSQFVLGLTDLCYLDFDNIKEESIIVDAMNKIRNNNNVLLVSRSISNKGLHVLIRYKLKGIETPSVDTMSSDEMQKIYGKVYDYFAAKYLNEIGLTADNNARHMDRVYIMSHYPGLYYNPNAEPLTIELD